MKRASSAAMRMSHSSARWNDPPSAQPWIATITGRVDAPQLLDPGVAPDHQLVMGQLGLAHPDRADVATRRPALALAPPDHRPHVLALAQLAEDVEQGGVHLVVEGVVLLGVVVGDRGDRPVDVEPDLVGHASSLLSAGSRIWMNSWNCSMISSTLIAPPGSNHRTVNHIAPRMNQ